MLRIGSLEIADPLVLAPMAGITTLAFRRTVKPLGPGLVTSEMVSAHGLVRRQRRTLDYLKSQSDERPLAVQIFGADPAVMAEAARMVSDWGADILDLNLGCPVKKVVRTGAGAALLKDPLKVRALLTAVRRACPLPLTVKTRAGWSPRDADLLSLGRLMEDCGVDALTLHPRFATQGFSGDADWRLIAALKQAVRIPVIGNGDVFQPPLALEMLRQTGCDGVMIGRGAIGNPWIFQQILDLLAGRTASLPTHAERRRLIMQHFTLLSQSVGEARAAVQMRGLLLRYTKGLPGSAGFRGRLTRVEDLPTLIGALDGFLGSLQEVAG